MIFVGWLGEGSEPHGWLKDVTAHVAREFEAPSRRWHPERLPRDAYDARRGQYSSRDLLAWISARLPGEGKVLAVTDVDLFIPVLTFVFGEAQLGGRAAIVSTWRLTAPGASLVRARLLKEAVHELGHTFGLVHCTTRGCVMTRSPGVSAVDAKDERLCGDCRIRYRERLKERTYAATNSENPDRR